MQATHFSKRHVGVCRLFGSSPRVDHPNSRYNQIQFICPALRSGDYGKPICHPANHARWLLHRRSRARTSPFFTPKLWPRGSAMCSYIRRSPGSYSFTTQRSVVGGRVYVLQRRDNPSLSAACSSPTSPGRLVSTPPGGGGYRASAIGGDFCRSS